jgi:hypothetical protein
LSPLSPSLLLTCLKVCSVCSLTAATPPIIPLVIDGMRLEPKSLGPVSLAGS